MQDNTTPNTVSQPCLKIEDIIIGERHRQDLGDIPVLAKSIQALGLLCPITLAPDHRLIAGRRRLEAVRELGWTEVPVHIAQDLDDAVDRLRAERDENECRKPFTPSEAVAIGKTLEELAKTQAAQRKREGAKKGGQARAKKKITAPNEAPGNLPGPSPETMVTEVPSEPPAVESEGPAPERRVRDEVAEAVGMSGRTYEKAKAVLEAAEENPERFGAAKDEMDRTGKVDPAFEWIKQAHRSGPQDGFLTKDDSRIIRDCEEELEKCRKAILKKFLAGRVRLPKNRASLLRQMSAARDALEKAIAVVESAAQTAPPLTPGETEQDHSVVCVKLADIRHDLVSEVPVKQNQDMPIVVFKGKDDRLASGSYGEVCYWLASGFSRYEAMMASGVVESPVEMHKGSARDAILYTAGVNEDKNQAVRSVLNDREWWGKADSWIAEKCHVDRDLVSKVRDEMISEEDLRRKARARQRAKKQEPSTTANEAT